jgi:hypothetical protein
MELTKEFLLTEIGSLKSELEKAKAFILTAQGAITAYQVAIGRIDAPEPEPNTGDNNVGNVTNNS